MFYVLVFILMIEILIIFLFIISALIENTYLSYKKKREELQYKALSEFLMECLENKVLPSQVLLKGVKNKDQLLTVLEAFNLRFQGGYWLVIKEDLSTNFLLPLARKRYASKSWVLRQYAARCFVLFPLLVDTSSILSLMKDQVFLVRGPASLAAIRLECQEGLLFMLKKIASEKDEYSKCFYKDLILQGSSQVFQYMEKVALQEPDKGIHLACLEILSAKVFPVDPELLQKDLISNDCEIRLAALKIYAKNPQKNSESVLLEAIESKELESRLNAAFGLSMFSSDRSLLALEKALHDICTSVRLQAAKSLKKIGPAGIVVLKQQDSREDQFTFEIANYVLKFF